MSFQLNDITWNVGKPKSDGLYILSDYEKGKDKTSVVMITVKDGKPANNDREFQKMLWFAKLF